MKARSWNGMHWIRPSTRLAIYLRDGLACVYCSVTIEDEGGVILTLDHVRPASKGGVNAPANLVTACKRCNDSRGKRPVATFARAVAAYRGVPAEEIVAQVRLCQRRQLPRLMARGLLARRGSLANVLQAEGRGSS